MSEYQYNKVTPEMIEKFKEIAPNGNLRKS